MIDVIVIADRSGSMSGTIDEARNSINRLIDEQKKSKTKIKFTFIMFDDEYEVVRDREDVQKIKHIGKEYEARGMTALLDAIGKGINHLGKAKKAMVTIVTDGYENASQEWTHSKIKKLVDDKKSLGWDFQFIGANIDAFGVGSQMGIHTTMKVDATDAGTKKGYAFATANVASYVASNS